METSICLPVLGNEAAITSDTVSFACLSAQYSRLRSASEFDIALVNVPYGTGGQSMRPLGLAALGAYLSNRGFTARGFDFSDTETSPEALVSDYRLASYPAVGLSFYNINAKAGYRLAKCIKTANSSCVVIAGGPHVSAVQSLVFEQHPEIDIVVYHEGEETLAELLLALREQTSLRGLPGIALHDGNAIAVGPERGRIEDLDTLPAPIFDFAGPSPPKPLFFYDRDEDRLKHAVALVTSRSCPFFCSFCAIILIGRKWRKSSLGKVIADFRKLEEHNKTRYEHVYFLDANFFVDARRTVTLAEAIHIFRPELTFSFSTRVNQLLRGKSLLGRLRALGLRAVELGIESGSEAALKRFAKDTSPAQNLEAVHLLAQNRVDLFLDFIMFDAEATIQDLHANLEYLEQAGLDSYVPWDHIVSHMTLYLGTSIRKHYERLVGSKFDADSLPDPEELFVNGDVRAVFREIRNIHREFPRLARAIEMLQSVRTAAAEWGEESARIALNIASIRRIPYVVLRNLVRQAFDGRPISYTNALPMLCDDAGRVVTLEEFLTYALQ